ncbi:MAG: hypothetical protein ACI4P6_02945 [Candidatus Spyradosoma sp.]
MNTKIQELEQQIDLFYKNIESSNELMRLLMSVASSTKENTDIFEEKSKVLYDVLSKLSPDFREFFKERTNRFVEEFHKEYVLFQASIVEIAEKYDKKIASSERIIEKIPAELDSRLREVQKKHADTLKLVQDRYATDLELANNEHSKRVRALLEVIQSTPMQIKEDITKQNSAFLEEFENFMNARLKKLSDIEDRIIEFHHELESKYNDFVSNLESTDLTLLYKYFQNRDKTINTYFGIVIASLLISIVVSAISLLI